MNHKSSSLSRILSASIASWVRIGVTVLTQVALVPIYLSTWTPEVYGAWILLQSVWAIIIVIDLAHHDFVGYECLQVGINKRLEIANIVIAAIPVSFAISLLDLFIVALLIKFDYIEVLVGKDLELLSQWRLSLILIAFSWVFTGSQAGLLVRWLTPFGYNPMLTWWGVVHAALTAVIPAFVVYKGASLLDASIALCVTNLSFFFIFIVVMLGTLKKEKLIVRYTINFTRGLTRGYLSLWLVIKNFSEIAKQQGVRIILAPLVGTGEMVAFTTMRTGSNFTLQALNTVVNPVMPELMNFLILKDQHRMESIFAVVWLVLCGGLAPAVLLIQYLAPKFFPIWTNHKILFDPWLFEVFSLNVLVLSLAQPAIAIVQGKNSLRSQLIISLTTGSIAVVGMLIFVPIFGIFSAACSMLAAEVIGLSAYVLCAQRLLKENRLKWPWTAFWAVLASVIMTTVGLTFISMVQSKFRLLSLFIFLILIFLILIWYWSTLPIIAKNRSYKLWLSFKKIIF